MSSHKQNYILRKRKDSVYYQVKLASWKTFKTLKTKYLSEVQEELQRILEKDKKLFQLKQKFFKSKSFTEGFFFRTPNGYAGVSRLASSSHLR